MQLQDTKSSKISFIKIIFILFLVLITLIGGLFIYFQIYLQRDKFPKNAFTVSSEEYQKLNYKKIVSTNLESSFYVPDYWFESDSDLKIYSDTLNGGIAYIRSYPNSLGSLNNDLCKAYSEEAKNDFQKNELYSSAELKNAALKEINGINSCYLEYEVMIANKNFKVNQAYFFRKNNIYQFFIQYQKDLKTQEEIANLIEKSIEIKE